MIETEPVDRAANARHVARLDVIADWHISTKLVSATADFLPDSRIPYSQQHNNYLPVANGGGAWYGMVDDGQVYATVLRNYTQSYPVDPAR